MPTNRPCGSPDVYCPAGSGDVTLAGAGYFTTGGFVNGTTRTARTLCPAPLDNGLQGVYCPGTGAMELCSAGFYGSTAGLSVPTCSGPCAAGWRCPAGSSNATALPCGGADLCVSVHHLHSPPSPQPPAGSLLPLPLCTWLDDFASICVRSLSPPPPTWFTTCRGARTPCPPLSSHTIGPPVPH